MQVSMFFHVISEWVHCKKEVLFCTKIGCADPESFVRGGSTVITFFLVDEGKGGSKYNYKRAFIGPPTKHH